jgi:PleD family two-component response regulator
MILAVLGDLMFSMKIKAAANQLGVDLKFSRSLDGALETMRKNPPALVIFDLNDETIGPLAIVAAMKQDPALAAIPTLGFASHVQTDVINAARAAGVGDVLARSAFSQQLGDILSPHKPS